jgi:hypothetical protein
VATTVVGDRLPLVHHRRTPTQAPTALQHVQRKAAVVAAAPVQVAAVQTSPSSSARRHVLRASAKIGATWSHRLVVKQRATSSAPVRRSFEPSHSAAGDSSAGTPPRRVSSHSNHDDQSESRRHAAAASAADEQDGSGSSSSSQDSSNQKSAPEDTNTVGDAAPTPTSGASPQD